MIEYDASRPASASERPDPPTATADYATLSDLDLIAISDSLVFGASQDALREIVARFRRPASLGAEEAETLAVRIVNGLEAAGNRFADLGEQAEADREFIGARYEAAKREGKDFGTASREARLAFVREAIATTLRRPEDTNAN